MLLMTVTLDENVVVQEEDIAHNEIHSSLEAVIQKGTASKGTRS